MSKPTDIDSIKSLLGILAEVNSLGTLMLGNDNDESTRKGLISSAEKRVLTARSLGEKLYCDTESTNFTAPYYS